MNFKNLVITALRALGKNKLRSALTSIGIIIGISSVIVMVGLGNSTRVEVREKVRNFGINAVQIYMNSRRTGKWMNETDLYELKTMFSAIEYITPYMELKNAVVKYTNKNTRSLVEGVNDEFFIINNKKAIDGRVLTSFDVQSTAKVAVIGTTIRDEVFQGRSPIGEQIVVNDVPLTVVGVLESSSDAFSGKDFNSVIDIPFTTFNVRFANRRNFEEVFIKCYDGTDVKMLGRSVLDYLKSKLRIPPRDYNLVRATTSEEKLKTADDISKALSILLAGIASISLFVGGVGVMNIMLVSVTERTREIGIRMAIGAKKRDIMMQFLIESIALSTFGGIIGITLGLTVYAVIVYFVKWQFIFTMSSVLVSAFFSTCVGVFFGYYPAKKAADLKPIEALKYE